MANPVVRYNGENITCFPSSNAKDFGKLHTEFNEARFVTRVAKKNFCIKNPCFTLKAAVDIKTNQPVIEVSEGEASINGMDIIASVPIQIGPPAEVGKWYLAFKLARDNLGRDFKVGKYTLKGNVLGDLIVGVENTFEGVYLTYYDKRLDEGEEDPDMLYLGSLYWNGKEFSEIEDDPQKYSRVEAEDVGCYIKDPKHADQYYMDLQSWIYKVPDWYFSKEGDVCYGEINVVPGRGPYPSPYEDPMPGFVLRAYDKNTTKLVMKASSLENATLMRYGDINNDGKIDNADLALITAFVNGDQEPTELQKELACVSGNREGKLTEKDVELIKNYVNGSRPEIKKGEKNLIGKTGVIYGIGDVEQAMEFFASNSKVEIDMNHAQLYTNFEDDIYHIHNPEGICIESGGGDIKLQAFNDVYFQRFDPNAPELRLSGNTFTMTDPNTPNLKWQLEFSKSGNKELFWETMGKAKWQYDNSNHWLSLLGQDITRFDIIPSVYIENATNRTIGTMYYGPEDGNNDNYMKKNEIQLDGNDKDDVDLKMTDRYVFLRDKKGGSKDSYFKVGATDGTSGVTAYSDGDMELKDVDGDAEIKFTGDSAAHSPRIYHNYNEDIIRIEPNLYVKNNVTMDGDTIVNGGDIHINNKGGNSNLFFSDGSKTYKIYHVAGENKLRIDTNLDLENNNFMTNGDIKGGTLHVGDNNQFVVDGKGNVNTSGTITASKVYGAVYNGWGEIFRKNANEEIEYGDLVCLREDGLVHKIETEADILNFIGICSDTIGMQLGGVEIPEDEKCEVELAGKIWAKTDLKNIKPGDHLIPTSTGKVKKVSKSSKPFAIAMTEVIDGKVKVFMR